MNANAKKWVKALKSGKFKRIKSVLRNEKGFCCLGVACELAVKAKVIDPALQEDGSFAYEGQDCFLPELVQEWLGLRDTCGVFYKKDGKASDLTQLNDAKNKTFKQIAKIIESEPEGLFV